jgi:hypothetical protein
VCACVCVCVRALGAQLYAGVALLLRSKHRLHLERLHPPKAKLPLLYDCDCIQVQASAGVTVVPIATIPVIPAMPKHGGEHLIFFPQARAHQPRVASVW